MSGVARVLDFLRSFEMRQTEESGWERFHRTGLATATTQLTTQSDQRRDCKLKLSPSKIVLNDIFFFCCE